MRFISSYLYLLHTLSEEQGMSLNVFEQDMHRFCCSCCMVEFKVMVDL